jgi:hypothetical protein
MKDAHFIADAEKAAMEIDIVTPEEIDALLKKAFATPPEVVETIRKAMGR